MILHIDRAQSSNVGRSPLTLVVKTSLLIFSSMLSKTSEIPKRPMTTGTSPTPSSSSGILNVNRGDPKMGSRPIIPMINPKTAIIRARTIEVEVKKVNTIMERTINEKYSGGPNLSARSTKGGKETLSQ